MDSTSYGATSRGGPDAMLPGPGDTILGKYRIEAVIGQGGMGIVMGAVDLSLGRNVAIKFLAPERATRPGAAMRFLREARSAAMIQSEHVVRVYEVSTLPNGAPFIVMEHLRGNDLAYVLKSRGPLPVAEACDILLQACEALGEAHMRGIVHRDLKPQNLFYTQANDGSPLVKVLDFGISKVADDGTEPSLTATDTVMGTPLYMSPEQVRSLKNVDARSDIWALGSILFELLTCSPIYQAPSASALCAMIAMDPPTPLRARRGDAPPALEQIILRCLHKDPNGRFADVATLAEVLAPFASDHGRQSAMRIQRVMRATPSNPGPAPTWQSAAPPVLGLVSTVGDGPRMSYPSGPNPTTQSSWQRVSGAGLPPTSHKSSSGIVVAVLGLFAGLLVLGSAVGGGLWLMKRRAAESSAAAAELTDASTIAPVATTPPTVVPSQAPLPTATPLATASGKPAAQIPVPGKDGGAPAAPKDAGAPAAPTAPPPDYSGEKRVKEQSCAFMHQNMNRFGMTPVQKKEEAHRAQLMSCRGSISTSCERRICREACTILSDDNCIRQLDYAEQFGPPPKY